MNKIDDALTRGVEQILPSKKDLADLMGKKKITLYQGFDPSMPSLHLGNFVGLMKLRAFQKLGHTVIFLVGDFTGMIGDPDKLATRKMLTHNEVRKNAEKFKEQAEKIINFSGSNPASILFNSDWNFKLTFKDLIDITSKFTLQQMIERDMFQERIKKDKPIYLHEFLYPIAQAYDCVHMDVDLEIGGNDQLFNMMAGRTLMKAVKGKEKFVLTTKLLIDKEGKKVGKTTGNALFLDSTPQEFYANLMSFPDEVISLGFELLTEVELEGIVEKVKRNPMNEKKRLAHEVVKILWGEAEAQKAQDNFEKTFQKGSFPQETKTIVITADANIKEVVAREVGSNSEAKRLLKERAIKLNGKTVTDPTLEVANEDEIKIGKKIFIKMSASRALKK
ncbi:tyrosine--tRNA ligase [Patescibacteria group bacterium]|nr:tyrosine--tRNA ligase [Patescibacteria group bacterium]